MSPRKRGFFLLLQKKSCPPCMYCWAHLPPLARWQIPVFTGTSFSPPYVVYYLIYATTPFEKGSSCAQRMVGLSCYPSARSSTQLSAFFKEGKDLLRAQQHLFQKKGGEILFSYSASSDAETSFLASTTKARPGFLRTNFSLMRAARPLNSRK